MDQDPANRYRDDEDVTIGASYGNEDVDYFGERVPYSDDTAPLDDSDNSEGETPGTSPAQESDMYDDNSTFGERLDGGHYEGDGHNHGSMSESEENQGLGDKIREKYNQIKEDI